MCHVWCRLRGVPLAAQLYHAISRTLVKYKAPTLRRRLSRRSMDDDTLQAVTADGLTHRQTPYERCCTHVWAESADRVIQKRGPYEVFVSLSTCDNVQPSSVQNMDHVMIHLSALSNSVPLHVLCASPLLPPFLPSLTSWTRLACGTLTTVLRKTSAFFRSPQVEKKVLAAAASVLGFLCIVGVPAVLFVSAAQMHVDTALAHAELAETLGAGFSCAQ
eukprot:SAG11_NODE_170_length_13624_cov_40.078226_3_plen_218_part_00